LANGKIEDCRLAHLQANSLSFFVRNIKQCCNLVNQLFADTEELSPSRRSVIGKNHMPCDRTGRRICSEGPHSPGNMVAGADHCRQKTPLVASKVAQSPNDLFCSNTPQFS